MAAAAAELAHHRAASRADIQRILDTLVAERQRLRSTAASRPALEANRLAIVYWQARLGKTVAPEVRA